MPLPKEDTTPPVTNTYLVMGMGGTGNAEFYPIEPAFNYLAA
jgi:hypothetical protein